MAKKRNVGGQAVIEGVMMKGEKFIATAVRKPDGDISVDVTTNNSISKKYKIFKLPIIRGAVTLIESLMVGMKSLNYSASLVDFEDEDDQQPSKFETFLNNIFKDKTKDVLLVMTMVLSLLFSFALFFATPTIVTSIFSKVGVKNIWLNIIEGILRVCIFLGYIFLISKVDDVKRVFEYHGAEHKAIFCYEDEKELTVENVKKYGRLHPRCGTNFLFLVMVISIIIFSLTGWHSVLFRLVGRLLLLPVVAGITYEIIKVLSKYDNIITKIVAYPGLKLQLLTTKEPDDAQIEVAIEALKKAEGIVCKMTIGEALIEANTKLKQSGIDTYIIDANLLMAKVMRKDKLFIMTNKDVVLEEFQYNEFKSVVNKRANKMPIKYITNECEFMGIDLYVEDGVLIPRPDTEILVESVIEDINKNNYKNICDLCCGSGAIGIAIANIVKDINVISYDISQVAEKVTRKNISQLSLNEKITFEHSDLLDTAITKELKFDMVVSNPPYIRTDVIDTLMDDVKKYEPHLALDGGADGLDFYRKITKQATVVLNENGELAFEIGHDQSKDVENILIENNFIEVITIKDLAGNDRVVKGIYSTK